ncbi:hypothetical protein Efla_005419 [Eimeria flavescens]
MGHILVPDGIDTSDDAATHVQRLLQLSKPKEADPGGLIFCLQAALLFLALLVLLILVAWKTYGGMLCDFYEAYDAPLEFQVVALKPPAPLYIFVPRVSYLPTLIDKCHEHFKPYIQPSFGQPTSPFFDFAGIPIDWRLPVGVAFDILSSLKGGRAPKRVGCAGPEAFEEDIEFGELAACGCDVQLPWCLTIHFHGSAASYLSGGANSLFTFQEFMGWASFESFFINSLKQATYIINGSAAPFQRLTKAAQMKLLTASRTGSIAQFLEGCNHLLPTISPSHFRRIPVRLYVCGPPCVQLSLSFPCFRTNNVWCGAKTLGNSNNPSSAELSCQSAESAPSTEEGSISPIRVDTCRHGPAPEDRPLSTLGDLLHHVFPQLFPKLTVLGESFQEEVSAAGTTPVTTQESDTRQVRKGMTLRTAEVMEEPGSLIGRRSCHVLVHGIQPLLQTPLFWLAATAPQLDMFLHVVILVDEALMGSL